MRRVGELVAIDDEAERAVRRRERPLGDALDEALGAAPVLDQVGDRADLEAVRLREHEEIGKPRHRAVGVHDLAQHRRGSEARRAPRGRSMLRCARAREHAARLRDQRKHVSRLHDVGGLRVGRRRHADRVRAIRGGNARGDAVRRFDRHREIGAVHRAVLRDHRREIEALGVRRGDRHADQSAAVCRQEVDLLGRDEIGGEDEIALVLAVLLVDEDGHPPGLEVGDEIGNGERLMARPSKGTRILLWAGIGRYGCREFPRHVLPGEASGRRAAVDASQSVCPPFSVASNASRCHDVRSRTAAGRMQAAEGGVQFGIILVEKYYAQCIRSRPDRRRLGRRHDSCSESRTRQRHGKEVQPGLLEATGPRVHEAVGAGIQKITAAPGKQHLGPVAVGPHLLRLAQGREAGGLHDRDCQERRASRFRRPASPWRRRTSTGPRSTPSFRWRSPRRRARRKAKTKAEAAFVHL